MIFDVFDQLLTSWRPGRCLKICLEAVRFISTEDEPMASHQTPKRPNFDDFWTYVFQQKNLTVCQRFLKSRSHTPPQTKLIGGKWSYDDPLVMRCSSKKSSLYLLLQSKVALVVKKDFFILSLSEATLSRIVCFSEMCLENTKRSWKVQPRNNVYPATTFSP